MRIRISDFPQQTKDDMNGKRTSETLISSRQFMKILNLEFSIFLNHSHVYSISKMAFWESNEMNGKWTILAQVMTYCVRV